MKLQFGAVWPWACNISGRNNKLLKSKYPGAAEGPNKHLKKEIVMKHFTAIALFIAASFITAGKAIAQDYAVQATIPFNFTVNGRSLPAGNYTLGSDITSPTILKIRERTQHANAMVMTMPSPTEKRKANELVFHKYGNHYFLSEIRSEQSAINLTLVTSKQEKLVRAETEQAGVRVNDNVLIALN